MINLASLATGTFLLASEIGAVVGVGIIYSTLANFAASSWILRRNIRWENYAKLKKESSTSMALRNSLNNMMNMSGKEFDFEDNNDLE